MVTKNSLMFAPGDSGNRPLTNYPIQPRLGTAVVRCCGEDTGIAVLLCCSVAVEK